MSSPRQNDAKPGLEPAYPLTAITSPSGLIADMRRSIARNEKAIVAQQIKVLRDVVDLQARDITRLDATGLFEAACHQRGAAVSTMLIEAGLRAHKSTALKLALSRGHLAAFQAQIPSIDQHEPLVAFYTGAITSRSHLLSATMFKGLAGPLAELLDKPVQLDEMFGSQDRKLPLLQPAQVAELLLSIACRAPPPHNAMDVLDVLIDRGANPQSWRFGIADRWITAPGDHSWVATAFSTGNLDMGVAMLDRCRSKAINAHTRDTLGHQCGGAIIEHAKSTSAGPARLEDRHRKAMQAIDAMGFPVPTAQLDDAGVWSYRAGLGDHRQMEQSSGEWLQALSARGHMAMETPSPQGHGARTPRF